MGVLEYTLPLMAVAAVLAGSAGAVQDSWNGLAVTPPMGWRSWNAFELNINQSLILAQVKGIQAEVNGKPSLLSYGYDTIGIDDGWQLCNNNDFHDKNGNPIINTQIFPDMGAMVKQAHGMNVKMGWYQNNCWCGEHGKPPHYANDANATAAFDFDSIKVDGCGPAHNISMWSDALNATGRAMVLENCGDNHESWSPPDPSALVDCRFNLYRISSDIAPQFLSTMYNLQFQTIYQVPIKPLSRPGCWSYPDMLEVFIGLDLEESRTHFSAWCVTSAPLTLGFDLTNETLYELAYPIITNKAAIAINQAWAGSPGRLVKNSSDTFVGFAKHGASGSSGTNEVFPKTQVWSKPLPGAEMAVLFINIFNATSDISASFAELGISGQFTATDVWTGETSNVSDPITYKNVAGHSSVFVRLTPVSD